ncbi:LacI family DNA-binding transcriptional regulator [Acidipropionibacterium timonense]|uniref:LacI family DNA-binding transcriptional regulator n=1 Tax=Acidipropionibacterium timonense TaxID=2161818 RepID=UPI0014368EB5|nr:substrate-binding domain-containing protein [Acidipropionibacterium timonense]
MTSARHTDEPGERATIYTVAERAQVSHQTVARYLRGERLRPANQARVEQALASLDYRLNETARDLATRKPSRLGALVFDVDDWAPQRVLVGASRAAHDAGYLLESIRVDPDEEATLSQAVRIMNGSSLGGVVVLAPPDFVVDKLDLRRLRVPWLIEAEPAIPVDSPVIEEHPIGLTVRHLAELGHERFFHLGGPMEWPSGRGRHVVFHEMVRRLGLQDCGATSGAWGSANGFAAMEQYPWRERPTALVAASDQIALGAMSWLHEHGYSVPGDVSITGLDGLPDATYYYPALTTIEVEFESMGERAVRTLLEGRRLRARPRLEDYPFEVRLVARSSSAAPGHGLVRSRTS